MFLRDIKQSFNAIILTDCDGVIEYVNPAFEKISGFSCAEVVGENPRIVKSGQHSKAYYKGMWEALSVGENWEGNFTNKAKDGHLYEVEQTIFPIFTKGSKKAIGYTAIVFRNKMNMPNVWKALVCWQVVLPMILTTYLPRLWVMQA